MTQELSIVKKQVSVATKKAMDTKVDSDVAYNSATELLSNIKKVSKLIKQEKDKVLKPLLEATKAERERWKPLEDDTTSAEAILKGKMISYVDEQEAKARKEEERIQKELEAGKIKKPETAAKKIDKVEQAPKTVVSKTGMSSVKKIQTVQIVDETKVPREYLMLDMVAIRRDALAGKEIPGVEVVEKTNISGR